MDAKTIPSRLFYLSVGVLIFPNWCHVVIHYDCIYVGILYRQFGYREFWCWLCCDVIGNRVLYTVVQTNLHCRSLSQVFPLFEFFLSWVANLVALRFGWITILHDVVLLDTNCSWCFVLSCLFLCYHCCCYLILNCWYVRSF